MVLRENSWLPKSQNFTKHSLLRPFSAQSERETERKRKREREREREREGRKKRRAVSERNS